MSRTTRGYRAANGALYTTVKDPGIEMQRKNFTAFDADRPRNPKERGAQGGNASAAATTGAVLSGINRNPRYLKEVNMENERSCGECYKCCVGLGITELKKYPDQPCRHLDGRNPTARCSIYDDRPDVCRNFQCLWRDGHLEDQDRPDKSGVLAHVDTPTGKPVLYLTLDERHSDETLERAFRWATKNTINGNKVFSIVQRLGSTQMVAHLDTGTGFCGTVTPVDYVHLRWSDLERL